MSNQNVLKLGDYNAICDVCGFKFKASDLQKRWDNQIVCKDDFEHRHPMDFFQGQPDDPSVPWTRSDANDYDIAEAHNGDVSVTLVKDVDNDIQTWNTELTKDRVVNLSAVNARKGDRFIIYKTEDEDNKLLITSTHLFDSTTV